MFVFRNVFLLVGLLAACTTLVSPDAADNIVIRNISVRMAEGNIFQVRGLPISESRFASDLKAAVEKRVSNRRRSDGNTDLEILVTRFILESPAESLVLGTGSFVNSTVVLRRVSDGEALAGPTRVLGGNQDKLPGGIVGVLTTPDAQEDYTKTIAGYAQKLYEALFEGAVLQQ